MCDNWYNYRHQPLEEQIEMAVSQYVGAMPFLWLGVPDRETCHDIEAGATAYEIDYLYPAAPADPSASPSAFRFEALAARAGVAADIIADAIGETRPAWALPYEEFTALADTVAALWPCEVFETAAACDLLLSCVLNGDQFIAADVLIDPCSQDLARTLLRLAVASEPGNALLSEDLLALLLKRAAALADSGSPDAWIGGEILLTCQGRQS